MERDIFQELVERWPSAVVARTEVGRFTGGMISGKYIANLDSGGTGPVRVKMGRRVGYPVKDFVAWLRNRSSK